MHYDARETEPPPKQQALFTNREYVSQQGFPLNHKSSEVKVKKQIGNAQLYHPRLPRCFENVPGMSREMMSIERYNVDRRDDVDRDNICRLFSWQRTSAACMKTAPLLLCNL